MRRVPAVLVPVFAAACGLPAAFRPGSTFAHLCYLIGFGTLVALGWMRLRTLSGPQRRGYGYIVAALSVWLVGDLLQDLLRWIFDGTRDVSPADLLWISGYPLLGIGLLRLVRLRAPTRLREAVLDALAMATVMAWLCWQFVILPAVEHERLSPAVVVGAIYPLGDVLLFAAGAILVLAPGSKRGPTRYLIAALAIALIGDIAISMLPTLVDDLSRIVQADRLDGILLLSNSLYVAAVLHPDAARIAEPDSSREERLHPARVIFLGIALAALPMFAGLQAIDGVAGRVSLLVSIAVLTALILVRFVLVVREQESVRAMLAHQAHHDQLTGLANRQALHAALDLALNRARDLRSPYAPVLFYLDLDGFKQVNDRYGHAAGDFVLAEFARRLKGELRTGDVAARLGGDEFVVLAENITSDAEAQALADRLRGLTDEPVTRSDDEAYSIGVSVGVAAAGTVDPVDSDTLLAAADGNMYTQKNHPRRSFPPDLVSA
ncbi:GGDEF domain-containing protein [Cryptosporangium arvum]|uniref:GGDEF domain-containing protein n=1 Tax=Cryptosporangium arvum TaxID=80871 RepID=UPI0009FC6CBA|nr:GGDEF domain-containing protein [Cryptosporangium arvum]